MSDVSGTAFRRLFDDAAMFPPGSAPLDVAVERHRANAAAWYADFIGPLVCGASKLAELRAAVAGDPIDVSVVAPCDWGLLESLLDQMAATAGGRPSDARIVAVELSLGSEPGITDRAGLVCKLLNGAAILPSQSHTPVVFVEVPPGPEQMGVLDVLAEASAQAFMTAGVAAKLRTGGLTPEAYLTDHQVAEWLVACATRALTFKCTAGLHFAVRYFETATGFEHQGFGNLLLATGASIEGAPVDDVAALLAERDQQVVVAKLRAAGENWLGVARTRWLSFGTCSVLEPIEDLSRLQLVSPPVA